MTPSNDDFARLFVKFTAAGWTVQTSIRGDAGNLQFTARGLEKMEALCMGQWEEAAALGELTDLETAALKGLIVSFRERI